MNKFIMLNFTVLSVLASSQVAMAYGHPLDVIDTKTLQCRTTDSRGVRSEFSLSFSLLGETANHSLRQQIDIVLAEKAPAPDMLAPETTSLTQATLGGLTPSFASGSFNGTENETHDKGGDALRIRAGLPHAGAALTQLPAMAELIDLTSTAELVTDVVVSYKSKESGDFTLGYPLYHVKAELSRRLLGSYKLQMHMVFVAGQLLDPISTPINTEVLVVNGICK